jgi:hypothetical protein
MHLKHIFLCVAVLAGAVCTSPVAGELSPVETKLAPVPVEPVSSVQPTALETVAPTPKARQELPAFKTITPTVVDGKHVELKDVCSTKHSPAREKTIEAFKAFRTAKLYMLAAIINANPTHDELQQAAVWQLGQVDEIRLAAKALNCKDTSKIRHKWYKSRLRWLHFKTRLAKALCAFGLPSWPKLGEWINKMRKKPNTLNDRIKGASDKFQAWAESCRQHKHVKSFTEPPPKEVKEAVEHMLDDTDKPANTEEVKKQVEAEIPAAKGMEAAVNKAVEVSPLNKNLPSLPLMRASEHELSPEIQAELQKKMGTQQLEVAKIDVTIQSLDLTVLC